MYPFKILKNNPMKKICSILFTLALPAALLAQDKPLSLDPAVRTGKLPNDFTYYIRHNEEPKNRVIMYLVNKAGSILEDDDQRGLAHFMEHMSFNGTTHFPHNELVSYLQKAGVSFGADINAYTSFDETVYQLPLPADKPGLLDTGVQIMRDWAHNATLDPIEIDKERGVVLEEKRLGKGANERMQRQYWPVLFHNSRYAVRVPIGLDTVLNNFKRPAIARFYNDWYRPDLQALVVVGDVDVNAMEQKIKKEFSDLKNPVHERPRIKYTVPLDGKNHFIAVTDKEMTNTMAEILVKMYDHPLKTAKDYRDGIITNLYNQLLGERYAELSRLPEPPYIQGGASLSEFMGGLSSFGASVAAKPGELEKGVKALWREVERVKRYGFSQSELDRAKASYLSNVETLWKEKNKTTSESYVQQYQQYFLKGTPSPGIDLEYKMVKADIPTITVAEVNTVSKNIVNVNRDIIILAPDKDKNSLPNEAAFIDWMRSVETEKLDRHKDDVSTKPLLSSDPVPGRIISEQKDTAAGTTMLILSNGIKVILKPTDFKNDQILFSATSAGGTSLASDTEYQSAVSAADIISACGVGNYNITQLTNYLSGKQVAVGPFISVRGQGLQGSCTPQDLKTALELANAYITEPRKDKEIFDGIISRSKATLANRSSDPKSVFNDTVTAVVYSNNIRMTGPSLEKLSQVNLDTAFNFYKKRFADASGMTFTFIGSIDTNILKPLLEKYIGSLPSSNHAEEARDLGIHIRKGNVAKNVYKGSEPQASVILIFSGGMDFTKENVVRLSALKETLEIRLLERLREDESGVYTPSVSQSVTKYPNSRYSFIVQFGCAPQNVDKLIASTLEEINKLKTSGPPEQNLEKWRAEDKSNRETILKTNNFWLSYINGQIENKEAIDEVFAYPALIDKLTVQDVKAAANEYLSGDNYIRLVLLPEQKTK